VLDLWVIESAIPGYRMRVGIDERPGTENAEPMLLGPREGFDLDGYYAAAFLVGFEADFGAAFLLALLFSFAANSCLTVAEMASTSTL